MPDRTGKDKFEYTRWSRPVPATSIESCPVQCWHTRLLNHQTNYLNRLWHSSEYQDYPWPFQVRYCTLHTIIALLFPFYGSDLRIPHFSLRDQTSHCKLRTYTPEVQA